MGDATLASWSCQYCFLWLHLLPQTSHLYNKLLLSLCFCHCTFKLKAIEWLLYKFSSCDQIFLQWTVATHNHMHLLMLCQHMFAKQCLETSRPGKPVIPDCPSWQHTQTESLVASVIKKFVCNLLNNVFVSIMYEPDLKLFSHIICGKLRGTEEL